MESFKDAIGGSVRLSYKPGSFDKLPEHVLVICKLGDKWLLTNHSKRGLEFPGGKVEIGESLEEAARREVMEEAGATISKLQFIGEYEVTQDGTTFVKAIFYGIIDEMVRKEHYFETSGPVLVEGDILKLRWDSQYSFIMKDKVIEKSVSKIMAAN
ncbi:RNA deprotection pyrophosphohydrolase [Cytobacillus dafuensis]|uniref:Nucleoside triphosphatase YtkD n=1 Tax=Cytobacillus dafuensis TaxID=1742359 RepID=A0A5B8Z796_CYTDA|nr:nucleoside triphosphatase YtkD [Cytobacillus dafuensis]QED49052.1 nucleoside triphosphatase YtkD [Cytobacillus dafuensis]